MSRRLIAIALASVFLLPGSSVALAAAPSHIDASGSVVRTSFVPSNFQTVGGVTTFDFVEHDTLGGTFDGTTETQGSCVSRASGATICQAIETFSGTVAGLRGTLRFRDVLFIDQATGAFDGEYVVLSGSGDLLGTHGTGRFQGIGGAGTYTGQLSLTPGD